MAARMDKRGNPATRSAQLVQNFDFEGEMPITESQVVIMIGKPRIEEAIKRKAVLSPVAIGLIVEEHNFIRTVNFAEKAKHLVPEGAEADESKPLHFVSTYGEA